MKKQILLLFLITFGITSYSQTISIQGRDWVGNTYIVTYPINTNLNSFNARYDRAGYEMYYVQPKPKTNTQYQYPKYNKAADYKQIRNQYFDPQGFVFEPTKEFWDNTGLLDKD